MGVNRWTDLAPSGGIGYCRHVSVLRSRVLIALLALLVVSCATKKPGIQDKLPTWVNDVGTTPLAIQDVRISASEGYRAVFLKLTRFPDSVTYSADPETGRINLDLGGAPGDSDIAEQSVVLSDDVVHAVRYWRASGTVHVVVELRGMVTPPYTVHEMADWIMVRLAPG